MLSLGLFLLGDFRRVLSPCFLLQCFLLDCNYVDIIWWWNIWVSGSVSTLVLACALFPMFGGNLYVWRLYKAILEWTRKMLLLTWIVCFELRLYSDYVIGVDFMSWFAICAFMLYNIDTQMLDVNWFAFTNCNFWLWMLNTYIILLPPFIFTRCEYFKIETSQFSINSLYNSDIIGWRSYLKVLYNGYVFLINIT